MVQPKMWLKYIVSITAILGSVQAMSQSFVNSSSSARPTFVVNFDISSVICQKTADRDDLRIFPISVLCNGTRECFANPAMDDETFPYCSQKCIYKCGPHGTCLMDGGRSLCYCDDGYSGKKCDVTDQNECSKKPCHWLARCTNTFGSYYCTCLPGFEGDGHNCTDIDECSDPNIALHCPENGKCCNIPGSYFCNCTDGFAPKGSPLTSCVDIDECAEGIAHCEGNTTCVNTIGSFHCISGKCEPGFQEINGECIDIDECKKANSLCDPRADCVNTNGSHHCMCTSGFTGDGKTCTPLSDCSQQPAICHKHAFCVSDLKMCICQSGYIGDGINCYDMNECSTDPPVCKASEKCLNLEGSFLCCPPDKSFDECKKAKGLACKEPCGNNAECRRGDCVCKDGFTGQPLIACSDQNECALNRTICPPAHWCVNLDGSYMCCNDNAPLTMCRGLLVGVAPEINEIRPNISTINITSITVTPSSPIANNLFSTKVSELSNATSTPDLHLTTPVSSKLSSEPTTVSNKLSSESSTVSSKLLSEPSTLSTKHLSEASTLSTKHFSESSTPSTNHLLELSTPSTKLISEPSTASNKLSSELSTASIRHLSESSTVSNQNSLEPSTPSDKFSISSTPSELSTLSNKLSSESTIISSKLSSESSTAALSSTTKVVQLPGVGFTVNRNTTAIPCSEERNQFCQTRNMSCSIFNGESRCFGCAQGFAENEHGICVDDSVAKSVRCAQSTDCDPNAKCIDINPTGHLCVCKIGFIGDGKRCDDVDECYTPNVCSPDAQCINTIGSYNCTCKKGFVGDGRFCSERFTSGSGFGGMGCESHPNLCHEFARCLNDECKCKPGFSGNGTFCSKHIPVVTVTDCVVNSTLCDPNAECVERHCQCRIGYLGNGILCRPDPDDCHLNISLCGPDSRCIARRCKCTDGKICKFFDCATSPELCHPDADCIQKLCHCKQGFEGNGTYCKSLTSGTTTSLLNGSQSSELPTEHLSTPTTKHVEVDSSTHSGSVSLITGPSAFDNCEKFPSVCHRNAKCIHNQCLCDNGYVGNGRSCIPDPNDCLAYPSICHPNAVCVTKMRCQCKPMFTGDGRTTCDPIKKEDNCALTPNLCHEHASCVDFKCHCNQGFVGDGKKCSLNTTDCSMAPSICHEKATCTETRCICSKGYTGNGTECTIDANDCTFGHSCDLKATCDNGKCKCNSGFTGNGFICTPSDSQSCRFNSTVCDVQADCIESKCICKPGYSGTGFACRKDDDDCFVNPELCDKHASCLKRQCTCNDNFIGNGTFCVDATKVVINATSPATTAGISDLSSRLPETNTKDSFTTQTFTAIRTDPFQSLKCSENTAKTCHKSAECVRDGNKEECRCHAGFTGDGRTCEDINECALRLVQCYKTATCVNTMGSFMCLCPEGQKGDGIHTCADATKEQEAIDVECERDGLTLLLNNRRDFTGKIFVKNQSLNPRCSKNYTTDDGPLYKFTALFAFCDVRMEAHNTFSTVIIIQKHPLFVTDGDEAYNLRCTYPAGELMLMSHFNVSMLSTQDTLSRNGPPPQCSLSVLSSSGSESVAEAVVGQKLQLRLSVEPSVTYGILAKNCVAVNMENGETYKLTDSDGCAIDASIFPEWSQFNKSQLYANFLTFKWPDTAQIRFQCDCSPCFDQCEPVKCKNGGEKLSWGRKKRSFDDEIVPRTNSMDGSVYSNVVQVRDSDKILASETNDEDVSIEMKTSSNDDSQLIYLLNEDDLCMNSGIFAAALGLAISFAAIITVAAVCGWQQRESDKLERQKTISVTEYDNRAFGATNAKTKPSRSHSRKRTNYNNFIETWSSTSTLN